MKLNDWLVEKKISQREFSEMFEPHVSQGLVCQWLIWLSGKGGKRITAERAIEIEHVTGGEVTRQETRPDLFEVKAA